MPKLTSEMAERYCQLRAGGKNKTESSIEAGYKASSRKDQGAKARKLEAKPHIAARIQELGGEAIEVAAEISGITKAKIMADLAENAEDARKARQFAARTGALSKLGAELGMFKEQEAQAHSDEHLDGLSADDLLKAVVGLAQRIGTIRVVDMTPEETREYIIRTAPRVGLRVEDAGEAAERPDPAPGSGLPTLQ